MQNTSKADTRKLLIEYGLASFESGKLESTGPEKTAAIQKSYEKLDELEHYLVELENRAALCEQVPKLLEALKATCSALVAHTPLGVRTAEKRLAALAIASVEEHLSTAA